MKKLLVPALIAITMASVFIPWVKVYDVPYPGVTYNYYLFGYELLSGQLVLLSSIVLAISEFLVLRYKHKIDLYLRFICCFLGVFVTVFDVVGTYLWTRGNARIPFIGEFLAMVVYAFLLLSFDHSSKKQSNDGQQSN